MSLALNFLITVELNKEFSGWWGQELLQKGSLLPHSTILTCLLAQSRRGNPANGNGKVGVQYGMQEGRAQSIRIPCPAPQQFINTVNNYQIITDRFHSKLLISVIFFILVTTRNN
jgi:hypothetical protein